MRLPPRLQSPSVSKQMKSTQGCVKRTSRVRQLHSLPISYRSLGPQLSSRCMARSAHCLMLFSTAFENVVIQSSLTYSSASKPSLVPEILPRSSWFLSYPIPESFVRSAESGWQARVGRLVRVLRRSRETRSQLYREEENSVRGGRVSWWERQ